MSKRNRECMPIQTGKLAADTWGMTTEQFGAYMLILMDLWSHGPVAYDDVQLAQITRLPLARWLKHSKYILRFLILQNGKIYFEQGRHIGLPRRAPLPPALRLEILDRDKWTCTYCGTLDGAFEIDHILPVAKGGTDEPSNLCVACEKCNRSKRDLLVEEWLK